MRSIGNGEMETQHDYLRKESKCTKFYLTGTSCAINKVVYSRISKKGSEFVETSVIFSTGSILPLNKIRTRLHSQICEDLNGDDT